MEFLNLELKSVLKFEVNEISEISEFSILGIGKIENSEISEIYILSFKSIGTFQFFPQFIKKLLDPLKRSDIIPVFEKLNHSNEANYRTVSILPLVTKRKKKSCMISFTST